MKKFKLKTAYKKFIADTITPVSVYLKIRDKYPNSILLESSDYHGNENAYSYIGFNPIATILVKGEQITRSFPDGSTVETSIDESTNVPHEISSFARSFDSEKMDVPFITNGLFGYIAYDAVRYFEDVTITKALAAEEIPDIIYSVYQNIIAINHSNNEAYILSHSYQNEPENLEAVYAIITARSFATFDFTPSGKETSNFSDAEYLNIIKKGKEHCQRGDVFQVVLSRSFSQSFKGDEFNVYRALRAVNPSPYLFYFDYGGFKIFGSSPEAQSIVKDGKAIIHPIAGTFKRTGNDVQDAQLANELSEDPKENAEHVMLVDLARNDLSRNGSNVTVDTYKEVQYYSHVIHLVSEVSATKDKDVLTMDLVADTFPAGTLSGSPKPMAMNLIDRYENRNRTFYGGCIGYMSFEGNFNSAIIIRSFLSKENELRYQAGAGVVALSNEESESQEVHNKLGALRKAIELAKDIK